MTDRNMIEMDLVSDVVYRYEKAHYQIEKPALGELMADDLDNMGMTAKEFAAKLGVSAPRISAYIHGKAEPTLKVARGLCDMLHLTPEQVLGC